MVGCAIAGVFAILEFLYGTRQSAKDCNKTWLEEMRGELDFVFQVIAHPISGREHTTKVNC